MAILNLDYYKGEDLYSDGDIEDVLLDIVEQHKDFSKIDDVTYPIIYHLSNIRENILNWYPFDSNGSLLEIGSGCGAITGMLCTRVKKMVSVELSKRRAMINYKRNQNADNLSIYVGNLNDMNFEQKFDYIVLNGVFEYAISYTNTDNPYVDFLLNIKRFLSENGKIIIAIENKYGLKYFAGAPEDHTNEFFLGLNGYKGNHSVRTFGKKELCEILSKAGLLYTKFYYPYPDYKFPNEIFTDESLMTNGYGRDYYNLNGDRYLLYNENEVARGLVNEGIISSLVNSFLIVASAEQIQESEQIIYAKINNDRDEQFRLLTKIVLDSNDMQKYVYKIPITKRAEEHINRMLIYCSTKNEKLCPVPSLQTDIIKYAYIEYETLDSVIKRYINEKSAERITEILNDFFSVIFQEAYYTQYSTEEFQNVFGMGINEEELCINNANIDLICDNVFCFNDKYYIIDYEWVFNFPIPIAFIKWRILNELYNKYNQLDTIIMFNNILKEFDIRTEDIELFSDWNYHFTMQYVGCDSLERYSINKEQIDLNSVMDNKIMTSKVRSYIYYDNGDGFSEENKIDAVLRMDSSDFKVKFSFGKMKKIIKLRWDPMENKLIELKITKIESDAELRVAPMNAIFSNEGYDTFLSLDPQYNIDILSDKISYIYIEGKIKWINDNAMQQIIDRIVLEKRQELELRNKYITILKFEQMELGDQWEKEQRNKRDMQMEMHNLEKKLLEKEKEIKNKDKIISQLLELNCKTKN